MIQATLISYTSMDIGEFDRCIVTGEDVLLLQTKTGADAKGFNSERGFTVCTGSKIVEQCGSKTFQESRYFDLLEKLKEYNI